MEDIMEKEYSKVLIQCPKCGNQVIINKVWYPGGDNDYGIFTLECKKCSHIFDYYLGRDVEASSVESGAKLINIQYKG